MVQQLKDKRGFTLVELVIVLAIGALIIAAVLVAVGGAQRSQRDSARKNIAARVGTALENYASNNNGGYPTATLAATYTNGIVDPDTNAAPTYGINTAGPTTGIYYASTAICGAAGAMTATGATPRNYAISYWSENAGAAQCTQNK